VYLDSGYLMSSHAKQLSRPPDSGSGAYLPWKTRVEEPVNRFVHYPIARWLVRYLVHTRLTANQVTLVQPFIAACAGFLLCFEEPAYRVAAVLLFGFRSLLDCVDGTLARAKKTASANGHAMDAFCDWLSATFFYAGIYLHLKLYPPEGIWSSALPVGLVVAMSLLNGALRSFSADYYLQKYSAVFETGRDPTVETLRHKVRSLRPGAGFFQRMEVVIGWMGHLAYEQERFDPEHSRSLSDEEAEALAAAKDEPLTRLVAALWSVSNGDFFLTLTAASVLFGWIWEMQVFFATAGFAWIVAVVAFNAWFIRRTARRAQLVVA